METKTLTVAMVLTVTTIQGDQQNQFRIGVEPSSTAANEYVAYRMGQWWF